MPDHPVSARAQARVGTTLNGKYRLDGLIGSGGMASVYSATHRNSKRVAVKMLHPELSAHEDLRVRFMREGYVANQVAHPGAVAVLDDDVSDDGAAFLVMELLDGDSIEEIANQRGKLPARAVLGIAYQVLDVLVAADAKGIVHRDIKPANLFLTRQGQVKVLDFGVARMAQGALTTQSGHTLGTPAFMSPEQALGKAEEIDARTDVWALGATMFALLSGRLVHEASTGQELMVFAATRQAKSLAEAGADAPAPVVEVTDKALAFRREDRYENAAAMRAAVGEAYQALYGESASNAPLAPLVSQVKLGVALPTSPSDPLAPTARADAVVSDKPRIAQEVIETKPFEGTKSIAGTTTETRRARAARTLRIAIAASLLVVAGGVVGAWVMRTPPVPAAAPPPPSIVTQPPPPPPSIVSVLVPAQPPPAVSVAQPTPTKAIVKPKPAPSASASRPHDSFDHQ
jgi:eukaryotic-like serine/threonine-protein kinase